MQSKNEKPSPISDVIATSLYAERVVINISNAAKHLFFPTPEESRISFTDRAQIEFKRKGLSLANDLTSILPQK
ncbi:MULTISPECIES: hypothetical protein [Legionella]|uniref:Uncharacterized protein n=1 Tax=Legionella resiliens TaxID=2905958 RepID=A0ABS8X5C3_9GAMM|nr:MULTISPECIES: hypothetical protein [unclassified Legionella]MCE0723403.1 hypothetical protein [Legionella sp. 9fVS26]MCE3532557.1 hypothetical protein [Legionella sp. 8cVS16]QLZ68689.1 hypothetical protein FOLKNPGA_01468 [Legionella sp. PC1000]